MGRSKFRTRSHEKGGGGHDRVLVHCSSQRTISGPGLRNVRGGDALRGPGTKAAALNNNARKRLILWQPPPYRPSSLGSAQLDHDP